MVSPTRRLLIGGRHAAGDRQADAARVAARDEGQGAAEPLLGLLGQLGELAEVGLVGHIAP